MKYKKVDDSSYVISIQPDEEIIEQLISLAEKENIDNASFYGIGALKLLELGYFSLKTKEYTINSIKTISIGGKDGTLIKKRFSGIFSVRKIEVKPKETAE